MAGGKIAVSPRVELMSRWVSGGSGCGFAGALAKQKRLVFFEFTKLSVQPNDITNLERTIDDQALRKNVVLFFLPHLRTAAEVAALLRDLDARDRWAARVVPWKTQGRGDMQIALSWKGTAPFSVMGVGPLGSLPASRRAPFFGLVIWGGGRENSFQRDRVSESDSVGLVDIPTGLKATLYKKTWKTTLARSKAQLLLPLEDAKTLRSVAFVLPRIDVEQSFPALLS